MRAIQIMEVDVTQSEFLATEASNSGLLRRLIAASLLLPLALLAVCQKNQIEYNYSLMMKLDRHLLPVWFALAALSMIPVRLRPAALILSRKQVVALALMIGVIGYAGHYLLLSGYDFSRDEQLANFDATIYGAGHLVWPLPPLWQMTPGPLNMLSMLPADHPVAWVSGYLPGNALLRVFFAKIGDAALTGAVLNTLSVLLVWGCARRLWPGPCARDREAGVVAVLLLAMSGQFVLTGMTAFAM